MYFSSKVSGNNLIWKASHIKNALSSRGDTGGQLLLCRITPRKVFQSRYLHYMRLDLTHRDLWTELPWQLTCIHYELYCLKRRTGGLYSLNTSGLKGAPSASSPCSYASTISDPPILCQTGLGSLADWYLQVSVGFKSGLWLGPYWDIHNSVPKPLG